MLGLALAALVSQGCHIDASSPGFSLNSINIYIENMGSNPSIGKGEKSHFTSIDR